MNDTGHAQFNQGLFSFIQTSPSAFHAAAMLRKRLLGAGFHEYHESSVPSHSRPLKGFVVRNGALIAFSLNSPKGPADGLRILGCHDDSPSLQLKPHPRRRHGRYLVAGVEAYGGILSRSWFDRELSLAGRISCRRTDGTIGLFLVDFKKPVVCIPSLALHLDRPPHEGGGINLHTELNPILGCHLEKDSAFQLESILKHRVEEQYGHGSIVDEVLGFDLFCYDCTPPAHCGLQDDFIVAPRLDNLLSCYVACEALCAHTALSNCMMLCMNHEEVGSMSLSGAQGNFAEATLQKLFPDQIVRSASYRHSVLISLDNAHATHPNYREKSDEDHEVLLNVGPVIKFNAAHRYSTTARTASLFKMLAEETEVTVQEFIMRSDMQCGSTIGPLTAARLGIESIDIGAATWSMHSIRETTGTLDPYSLFRVASHFCNRAELPQVSEYWG